MKRLRRILTVLFAYISAAVVATLVLLSPAWIIDRNLTSFSYREIEIFLVATYIVSVVMIPVALPIVIFHEVKGTAHWLNFVSVGLFAGLALLLIFSANASILDNLWVIVLVPAAIMGTMTYWLIAWRLLPPAFLSDKASLERE